MRSRSDTARATVRSILSAAAPMLALAASVQAAEPTADQIEICKEAALRYEEMVGSPVGSADPPVVLMFKHTFCPLVLRVKQGSSVRFVNVDKRTSHSFWFRDAGRAESERYFSGEGATIVIDLPPGEHTYLCGPHWEHQNMVGKIIVVP